MKLKKYIVLMAWPLAFIGCDKVEVPIEPEVIVPIDTTDTTDTIVPLPEDEVYKKILVEEFTGHECQGCPANTQQLLDLQQQHKDQVIVVSYHAGHFAFVNPPKYLTDFQTSYGDYWNDEYDFGQYPYATIDRKYVSGTKFFLQHSQWESPIIASLDSFTKLKLETTVEHNSSQNIFSVEVIVKSPADLTGFNRLVLLCLEDSVIAPQKDVRLNPNQYPDKRDTAYVHRHVMRKQLNESAGIHGQLISNEAVDGVVFNQSYSFPVPSNVSNPANCSIVVFLVEYSSDGGTAEAIEVKQAEEVHVH